MTYLLYCNNDIPGNSMQELYNVTSLEDCVTACALYSYQIPGAAGFDGGTFEPSYSELCTGVFFGFNGTESTGYHPTRCYLKYEIRQGTSTFVGDVYTGHAAALTIVV
jgi:hypothetical protein